VGWDLRTDPGADLARPLDPLKDAHRGGAGAQVAEPEQAPRARPTTALVALLVAAAGTLLLMRAFQGVPPAPSGGAAVNGGIAYGSGKDSDVYLTDAGQSTTTLVVQRHAAGHVGGVATAWSPDGTRVAFTDWTSRDTRHLYVMSADATDLVELSAGLIDANSPAWSTDGTKIAFTGVDSDHGYEIYVVGADGTGRSRLTDEADNGVDGAHMPAWSPDGTQIAYSANRYHEASQTESQAIFTMAANGSDQVQVTDGSAIDEAPMWSPDGTKIAFSRKIDGNSEVFVANVDGTGVLNVSNHPALDWATSWSPDGTNIVLVSNRAGDFDIYITGESLTRLTDHPSDDHSPVWSPDGTRIAFASTRAGSLDIYAMNMDGTDVTRMTDSPPDEHSPAWLPLTETVTPAVSPRVTATIAVGSFPRDIAVGAGAIWVSVNDFSEDGPETHAVVRVDPSTNEIVATVPVGTVGNVAIGSDAVWTIDSIDRPQDSVIRIDPATNQVIETIPIGPNAFDIAVDGSSVWVTRDLDGRGRSGEVIRIDPATNEVVARIPVDGRIRDVVVGEGGVWVVDSTSTLRRGPALVHIDPETNEVVATIPGLASLNVATGGGLVWIQGWLSTIDPSVGTGSEDRPVVLRIDPATGQFVGDPIPMAFFHPFAVWEGSIWFVGEDGAVARLDSTTLDVDRSVDVAPVAQDSTVHAAIDINNGTIWVANYQDAITRIDLR
jgi:TolB protein